MFVCLFVAHACVATAKLLASGATMCRRRVARVVVYLRLSTPGWMDAMWKLFFDGVVVVVLVVAFFVPPRAETETVFVHVADE